MAESLFTELKRRNVFRVATAYIVLAWVIIQVTDQAVVAFDMPDWVNTVIFFFGLVGFPFVLLFAWAFELTPDGIKRESEVTRDDSITRTTGETLNYVIIGLLSIAVVYLLFDKTAQNPATSDTELVVEAVQQTEAVSTQELIGSSIAVLPFVNMSSDPEQVFFSDGISEEILNVLAQIPNLHVTSRSSAFAFKGKEINLSEVAKKLGVANILEGSVRKAGNKVRITAQLIEAETDKHLWSATYDRELDNIFAIQDEISGAIVLALKDKLGFDQIQLVAAEEVDLAAHEAYLKGRHLIEKRNPEALQEAIVEFDKAIAIEPAYAEAWMGKAWATVYLGELRYGDIPNDIAMERAQFIINKALQLNPNLPENHAIQGLIYSYLFNTDKASAAFEQAIALNPNYSNAYVWYADVVYTDNTKSLELYRKAYILDPVNILSATRYVRMLSNSGRFEEAWDITERLLDVYPDSFSVFFTRSAIRDQQGRIGEAAYLARRAYQLNTSGNTPYRYAFALTQLGLIDDAVNVVTESGETEYRHFYSGNYELFITEIRAKYPRSENDEFGKGLRTAAEVLDQNFEGALRFIEESNFCSDCSDVIISHKMLGNQEFYKNLLEVRYERLRERKANGIQSIYDTMQRIDLLMIEDKIEDAVLLLDKQIQTGYSISFRYLQDTWRNKPLHEHPRWAELLRRSNIITERERQIYLDLVAMESSSQ